MKLRINEIKHKLHLAEVTPA